jgi:ankyrin repeat protein
MIHKNARKKMSGAWFQLAVVCLLILLVTGCTKPEDKLIQAVKEGAYEKAQKALKKGASPNTTDDAGTPVCVLALEARQPEIAELLIQHGAKDVNAAILLAVRRGYGSLVSQLFDRGADPAITDNQGNTLIDIAVAADQAGLIPQLREAGVQTREEIQQAEEARRQIEQATADLFAGVREGDLERVRQAVDTGIELDQRISYSTKNRSESSGWTALMVAVQQGHLEIARWLVEQGADVNAKNQHQYSALSMAIEGNHAELIKLLAQHGADLEVGGRSGTTALMKMAWEGNRELVTFLLEQGADPNTPGVAAGTDFRGNNLTLKFVSLGAPALSSALRKGHFDIAELLIEAGADVNLYTHGWTMLLQEALWSRVESVEFLLEHGADVTLPLRDAYGFEDGCTPLILAAIGGHAGIVTLLLEHGADSRATCTIYDHTDRNALYFAELEEHVEAARLLQAPVTP